ncbi:uncharacterized protein YxjI [Streptococcus rupicaprae]|uniref:Uncharacterized protein YxjI n=1 Tax=Streptococcus rupicaprae TaxID=759619 RepID=A0ABV2FFI5_9STRE
MKLYMTQDKGTLKNNFTIYNESEELLYRVKGNIGMFTGTRSSIYNSDETQEVAFIKQRFAQYKWDVIIGGQTVATISKKWFSPRSKYKVEILDWQITGRLLFHDYKITDNRDNMIAQLQKKAFRLSDSFEISLDNPEQDALLVVAVVVAIDAAIGQTS